VSSLYDAFPKVPEGGEGISANVSQRKKTWAAVWAFLVSAPELQLVLCSYFSVMQLDW